MSSLSEEITRYLCEALRQTRQIDVRRGLLAERFSCAPSQITYVLSTRFTPRQGYRVESRRGGGGYIRIIRLDALREQQLQGAIRLCGNPLSEEETERLLRDLVSVQAVTVEQAHLLYAALGSQALKEAEDASRLRARLLGCMLDCLLEEEKDHAL